MVTFATNLNPPPEGVPPAMAPRMGEHVGMERPRVWSVREADIESIIQWLHPKLLKRWPRCLESSLRFWLKSAMSDKLTRFVCSENVCAMVHVMADVKEPMPRVIENFLRGNDRATEDERQTVYAHLAAWAQSIGAREFVFGTDTDARMTRTAKGQTTVPEILREKTGKGVWDRTGFAVVFKDE